MTSPNITIDEQGGSTQTLSQTIAGTVQGVDAGTLVSIFDNSEVTPIATAVVSANDTWSTEIVLAHGANAILASITETCGQILTSHTVNYDLEYVLSPPSHDPGSSVSTPQAHASFVFNATPGRALVSDFHVGGRDHEVINLPSSEFTSIAAILHNMHTVGHDTVIALSPGNSVTIEGISAPELRAHPNDFQLQA